MFQEIEFKLRGLSPLMYCNPRLANPGDPIVREIKKINAKGKNKTDDDYLRLFDLQWEGGIYIDADRRVIVPGEWIEGVLVAAAKKSRKGQQGKAGISCNGSWPLEYDGPKDFDKLAADPRFRDVRNVVINGKSRVMACRPIFPTWAVTCVVTFDTEIFNLDTVCEMMVLGGRYHGLGTYRPKYGRYVVESPVIDLAPEAKAEPTAKSRRRPRTEPAEATA
jgi:hypothetical protein